MVGIVGTQAPPEPGVPPLPIVPLLPPAPDVPALPMAPPVPTVEPAPDDPQPAPRRRPARRRSDRWLMAGSLCQAVHWAAHGGGGEMAVELGLQRANPLEQEGISPERVARFDEQKIAEAEIAHPGELQAVDPPATAGPADLLEC